MKKSIALLLCLSMLLVCCAVPAGADGKESLGQVVSVNGSFNIRYRLPEGYKLTITEQTGSSVEASVASDAADKPRLILSVSFNDLYTQDGVAMRLNDLSEEELSIIKESFLESADDVEFRDSETSLGTKVLIVKGLLGNDNFVDVYSIYNSYEIEALVLAGPEAENGVLTEDQIRMVVDFFGDIDFEAV